MGSAIQLVTSKEATTTAIFFPEERIKFMGMAESGKKQIKGWIKARVVKKLSGFRKKRKREMEIRKILRRCWKKVSFFIAVFAKDLKNFRGYLQD